MIDKTNNILEENSRLTSNVHKQNEHINLLHSKIDALVKQINNLATDNVQLTQKLSSLATAKSDLESDFSRQVSVNEKLTENVQTLNLQSDKLKSKLKEREDEESNLRQSIYVLSVKINKMSNQTDSLNKKNEKLLKEAEQFDSSKKKLENKINALEKENSEVKQKYSDLLVRTNELPSQTDSKKIENGKPNVGTRIIHHQSAEDGNRFEYIGETTIDKDEAKSIKEAHRYPCYYIPKLKVKILNWLILKENATIGVTEPLLRGKLAELTSLINEIEIIENSALPIRNRNYSYKPDLLLFWKDNNICLDIEIDEPYDFISRKPLHYIDCADNLRNYYFIQNGWFVLRFSEIQIKNNLDDVYIYILSFLKYLTGDARIHESVSKISMDRWTDDQAREMAENNEREKYLNLDVSGTKSTQEEEKGQSSSDEFIPLDNDILEVAESENEILLRQLKERNARYLKIIFKNTAETIISNDSNLLLEKKYGAIRLKYFDCILDETKKSDFDDIKNIEPLDSIYSDIIWNKTYDKEKLNDYFIRALKEGSPIHMKYTNAQGEQRERTLCFIIPLVDIESNNIDPWLITMMDFEKFINENKGNGFYFRAYCSYRKTFRTFLSDRIDSFEMLNCKNTYFGDPIRQESFMYAVMTAQDIQMADYFYKIMNSYEKSIPSTICNYAHLEVFKGNIDHALELYKTFDYDKVITVGCQEWGKTCMDDIEFFIKYSKQKIEKEEDTDIFKERLKNFKCIKENITMD